MGGVVGEMGGTAECVGRGCEMWWAGQRAGPESGLDPHVSVPVSTFSL